MAEDTGDKQLSDAEREEREALGAGGQTSTHDQVGKGFNPSGKTTLRGRLSQLSLRQKAALASSAIGLIGVLLGGLFSFNFLNNFKLENLMNNIERHAFIRYQVDMEGRSNAWISAYLAIRLAEVTDSALEPKDRDNIIFRSNTISAADPNLKLWYFLLRGSRFEQDLLETDNIKFTSIAYKENGVIKFRPAIISYGDQELTFEPTDEEIKAIENGDVNKFNGRLREFVKVQVLQSDKEGRREIAKAVKAKTKWYQVMKRYFLRKSIQNMTGIRDWRFFETTRNKLTEKKISIRNKIITKTFPESMKGGKYIQCFFGIVSCKTTTDPSNPENKSPVAPLPEDCNTSSNPECKVTDAEGNSQTVDDSAAEGLQDGMNEVDTSADQPTENLTKKFISRILDKLNVGSNVVSILETLKSLNTTMRSGALSNMVAVARTQAAIAMFATFAIMQDQIRSGEVTAGEVNDAMEVLQSAGQSQGWQEVVADKEVATATAAEFKAASTKEEYCSAEHQEQMLLPENKNIAQAEYHWLCESEKLGGDSLAKDIEDGWNGSIGIILNPIMEVYEATGISTVVGWFGQLVEDTIGKAVSDAVSGILEAVGLKDNLNDLVAWLTAKAASILGAGPPISENAPGGVFTNHILMGASAAAESAARNQGAAITNEETALYSKRRVAAYMEQERSKSNPFQRYFALGNPNSTLSKGLFTIADSGLQKTIVATLANVFSGGIFARGANADTSDGYAAAKFAGLETYDYPAACMDQDPLDMTPQSATNADDLGIIPANELTWELVGVADVFYPRLYQGDFDGEKNKKVYNCALLDSSIRGSLGAKYSPKTLDANAYGYGYSVAISGGVGDIPQGTTQELAQKILSHPNIDFQVKPAQRDAMLTISQGGRATQCDGPKVSPVLLGVLLAMAEKYKIVVGVLVDGHECDGGFHPKGMAADLNGVKPLVGNTGSTGNSIPGGGGKFDLTAAQEKLVREFYNDLGALLSQIGGGGMGQIGCFSGTKPTKANGVTYFDDTCHHIHFDVRKQ